MAKKAGLGRGLEAIFLDNSTDSSDSVSILRISEIEPKNNQPRKSFDKEALAQLADSIASHGLIQPIIVRSLETGFYQIVAGERRWRAAKMAGLTEIPVIVMEIDDKSAAEIALIENIQREDLNAIEEAMAYKSLIKEHDLTQEEISRQIGKSRSAITNSLRLLDLPDEVIEMVASDKISAGHARTILGLKNTEDILPLANSVYEKELSVRITEETVKAMNKIAESESDYDVDDIDGDMPKADTVDYISEIEKRVLNKLGRRIKIKRSKKIEIEFENNDDLESLIKLLCGNDIFND